MKKIIPIIVATVVMMMLSSCKEKEEEVYGDKFRPVRLESPDLNLVPDGIFHLTGNIPKEGLTFTLIPEESDRKLAIVCTVEVNEKFYNCFEIYNETMLKENPYPVMTNFKIIEDDWGEISTDILGSEIYAINVTINENLTGEIRNFEIFLEGYFFFHRYVILNQDA